MIVLLARVLGMGIETADMLVREALSRNLARPAGCGPAGRPYGAPDKAAPNAARKGLPGRAARGCARA